MLALALGNRLAVAAVQKSAGAPSSKAVGNVQVAAPVMKQYRAVVRRTVYETAVVEFTASETDISGDLGSKLGALVAEDQWTRDTTSDGLSYCYVDRVETIA